MVSSGEDFEVQCHCLQLPPVKTLRNLKCDCVNNAYFMHAYKLNKLIVLREGNTGS